MNFSDWLYAASGQRHGIALTKLVQLVFNYLTDSPLSSSHMGQQPRIYGRIIRKAGKVTCLYVCALTY